MSAMSNLHRDIKEQIEALGYDPPYYFGLITGKTGDSMSLQNIGIVILSEKEIGNTCDWTVYVPEDAYESLESMGGRYNYSLDYEPMKEPPKKAG